ncbi:hypothetical protein SCHPADRAFT_816552 [Schizopora paradoxa]|uniref:Exocyst complex component Sec3 PIP2-binding N-terminal domain-containing protein n=1 Tax=Schizopora paradoxa TaxID=27342 RepID=A0A0H2SFX6_9AGAM|nr:hypothetical protein SCHPADRAFT_816552 [Schizopora paradoxa]
MSEYESVKQKIIQSVFPRRPDEEYVSHLKIWENDNGADKPRFILLSRSTSGTHNIHKSRLNPNGTFSVGKTWKMSELHGVEVQAPLDINITFARSYRWQTESQNDQDRFLDNLVKLYRETTGSTSGLRISQTRSSIAQRAESPVPIPRSALNGSLRAASPAGSYRSNRTTSPSRTRPSSPSKSDAQSTRRRPPNGTARSAESIASPTPTITIPSSTSTAPSSWTRDGPSSTTRAKPSQPFLQTRALSSRSSLDAPPISPTSSQNVVASPNDMLPAPSPSRQLSTRTPSPAASISSRRSQRGKTSTSTPEPPLPTSTRITAQNSQSRRDPNARISFFDSANQALLDRLLSSASGPSSSTGKTTDTSPPVGAEEEEIEDEGENTQATLADIEEMLDGYEFLGEGMGLLKPSRGPADHIESRLLDELMQLERANIHSFLESDDRISTVMQYLDEAITELDGMESTLSSYKIHLNAVGDDIAHIQSQNRGLQVQTQNQKVLLSELEKLLQTVHVDRETLLTLTQESLEKTDSIQRLEEAAVDLYKALLAGRDNDMAATMERLDEYRTHNIQFCKRILDFLTIMFTAQSNLLLKDGSGVIPKGKNGFPEILSHQDIEAYLGRYCGLMLYLKEMDEGKYSKLCAAYFSAASDLHSKQVKALVKLALSIIKRPPDEEEYQGFSVTPANSNWTAGGLRRAGTIVRSPLDNRKEKEKGKQGSGTLLAQEALDGVLEQLAPLVYHENEFIADFLQINDVALTFADYMGLDHYFRRQAAEFAGLSQTTAKLIRGAMDLIFGSLSAELKTFIDDALSRDQIQVAGLLASLERSVSDAEVKGNVFFVTIVEKQHQRLKSVLERFIDEQIRDIEQTRLTAKKRSGVVQFIKYFPTFVGRIETQLVGANDLEVRGTIDASYDKIVQAMFDSLKQMAKLDGEQGEEKGQLNYHVIIIENMHHFIAEIKQSKITAVGSFRKQAEAIYNENLTAYVKLVMRRPFAKIIDYFEGVDRLLKTVAPTEVAKNSAYNRSALKKVVKEYDAKDIRKYIDALFKRVEKHFTDGDAADAPGSNRPNAVLTGVWKACEEDLLRDTDMFTKRIKQCYSDTGVTLDYSKVDVETAFRKHSLSN